MNAGFIELDSDDIMFDIVQAERFTADNCKRYLPRAGEQSADPAYRLGGLAIFKILKNPDEAIS